MEEEAERLDGGELERYISDEEDEDATGAESITLELKPAKLPKLKIVDSFGVTRHRTVGIAELLTLLDHSATIEKLREEAERRTEIPELPPNTMYAAAIETPWGVNHVATGVLAPRSQAFVHKENTYLVELPSIVWKALHDPEERRLKSLRIALADPGDDPVTGDTPVYRWPFSNVYAHETYTEVCWYTMKHVALDLNDAVRLGVEGFLTVPDNGDLFGRSRSQNSPHKDYDEFLRAVQTEGLQPDWLIPHLMTVKQFHEKGYAR